MSFKIRESHWEIMLEYMEEHMDFANGRFIGAQGREIQKKMWNELSNKLNSLGFGNKTADKWQKTWSDFKYQIKKKGSLLKLDQHATGGGMPTCAPFNSFEQRALNILGGKQFYMGVGSPEVGFTSTATRDSVSSTKTPHSMHVEKTHPPATCSTLSRPHPHFKIQDHILNSEIEEPEQSPRTSTVGLDHNYDYAPPKKRAKMNESDKVYAESITILKEIKSSLDDLKSTVAEKLGDIADAIKSK